MSDGDRSRSGWWPSRLLAGQVAAGRVSRSGLAVDADTVYWCESRPDEGGRQVVVGWRPGGSPEDLSPAGVSVRSRVHEYGGAAALLVGGDLYYVDQQDQRWYRTVSGSDVPPIPLTPGEEGRSPSRRYADGRVTPDGRWLVCVEERLVDGTTGHALVAVATDGSSRIEGLESGSDFVAAPRISPDGRHLAWVSWDHPAMPWDRSALHVAELTVTETSVSLGLVTTVAGGPGRSVGQPRWCRDGALVFVDDRSEWWRPFRLAPGAEDAIELVDCDAEFHSPDWALGQATIAELAEGALLCRMRRGGRDHLVRLVPGPGGVDRPGWGVELVDQPCRSLSGVAASGTGTRAFVLGTTATEAHCVLEVPLEAGRGPERLSRPPAVVPDPVEVSVPMPFVAEGPGGEVPGVYFAPVDQTGVAAGSGVPPLVVFCHGGPTGASEVGFDPTVQFFTSRGLGVAAVDYRGSTGYGRSFRQRLAGEWGVADVDDCAAYAEALAAAGRVDGERMAIRGTSAGGLTALGALVRTRLFLGAASWYGVTDLEALAAETHDFESSYLETLIGPLPATLSRYEERSPIRHPDRIAGSVLLLQGADDPVVPAAQSVRFAEALRAHGVGCRLVVFEGESHGFRSASTIEACLSEELDFYRSLFAP